MSRKMKLTMLKKWDPTCRERHKFNRLSIWGLLLGVLTLAVILTSCKTSNDPVSPEPDTVLQLDVVPLLLKADTLSTSTVWATLMVSGEPAPDSTAIYFLASPGTIDQVGYTKDGLAVVTFHSVDEPGIAVVVGQALTIRDTVRITLY